MHKLELPYNTLMPIPTQNIYQVSDVITLDKQPVDELIMHIRESIGFGIGGLGGILIMVSIFEIIGLSILLYLSSE